MKIARGIGNLVNILLVSCGLLSLAAWLLNAVGVFDNSPIQPSPLQLYGWIGIVVIGAMIAFSRMLFANRPGE